MIKTQKAKILKVKAGKIKGEVERSSWMTNQNHNLKVDYPIFFRCFRIMKRNLQGR
jgi:hypothetical protein